MRAQGFVLSKIKGDSKSAKFGVPSTKDMYSGWSKRSYLREKKKGLHTCQPKRFLCISLSVLFCKRGL